MIKSILLSFALLVTGLLSAQQKFKIQLFAPSYVGDSILFAPSAIRKGFEEFYNFKLNADLNIHSFGEKYGLKSSIFQLNIQENNILEGKFDYPQPVSFQYFDVKTREVYFSSTFFLDSGSYKIDLPKMFDAYQVFLNSPINNENQKFKKIFSDLYIKTNAKDKFDSLIDLTKKEERIGSYIKKHPSSFVALWEIVSDYTLNDYSPIYYKNLQLFSNKVKKTELFKKFENKLLAENYSMIGKLFPTIVFDKKNKLSRNDFKNFKLTFIDYWSTTCLPCIRSMPVIAEMYNQYKDRGVNFITVTDENEPERIELAKSILARNKIKWKNYFDTNKDFRSKVNATSYPLHFLVDQNGKIVLRIAGEINEIKKQIEDNLK